MGNNTNNGVDNMPLIKGIPPDSEMIYTNLIKEGDSQILICTLGKIIHGTNPNKVSSKWWLSSSFGKITKTPRKIRVIIPSHVKQRANVWVKQMANEGFNIMNRSKFWQWNGAIPPGLKKIYN